jgi:Fusaric acid resistance protein-like
VETVVFNYIQFTREDTLHASLGVIPAFVLIATGHLTVGIAFAIGLLPTSLMGIAPRRKLRVVYGIVGCLFGLGILVGALIINAHDVFETAFLFLGICFLATLVASTRPVGTLLLGILIPSLGIGTGYEISKAAGLMLAFMAGSVWSSLVMLPWPEAKPDPQVRARLTAMRPRHVKTYGVLLGLTAATAIFVGHYFDIPYPGWIATAAMLVIRPVQDMTGWRGVGRAISTIAGTLLVVFVLSLSLTHGETAVVCAVIAVLTIGARTSKLYVTPFGTAFLILTIELYGVTNAASVEEVGRHRIVNNVLGALIALFYGLLVSWLLERTVLRHPRTAASSQNEG